MLKQPVGVIQMTNVAIIRYRLNNKHFEIACYKNKAIDWRNGIEKDLTEVLQIDKIFTSASHGQEASKNELTWYFPNMNKDQIMKTILEKGDLQIGERERENQIDQNYKGVVKFIQEKCVHSKTKRPFDQQSIEHAIGRINFIIRQDQPIKRQALQCIKQLQDVFFIQRAEMQVEINILTIDEENFLKDLKEVDIETEPSINRKLENILIQFVIDPAKFRVLSQILKDRYKKSSIEVIEANIANREVTDLETQGTVELELRPEKAQQFIIESKNTKQKGKGKKDEEEKKQKDKEKSTITSTLQQEQLQAQLKQIKSDQKVQEENKGKFKCSICLNAYFETNPDFRQHYKSDWHTFNLKLKNKGQTPMTNEEYLEFLLSV